MPNNASMIFVVSAKDDATKTIEQINRQIANVGKSAGGSGGIELPGFDLGKITNSISQLGSAGGAMGLLGDLIPVAGLGVAAGAIGAVAWQMGEAGAQTLRTKEAFASLATQAGTSAQSMLSAMQNASRGTIADADLMAAANRALVLGVATSAEQMGQLTAAAIAKGRQVGVGATQAISDLISGIGRMSPEILDNLGIVGAKGAFDAYAATLGTTADKLTDVQKKQALVNQVLESTKGVAVVDDAAASFERMNAAIQNAKDALGELFGPAIAVIADRLAQAASGATDMMKTEGIANTSQKLAEMSAQLETARDDMAKLVALQTTLSTTEPAFLPIDLQQIDPRDIAAQIAQKQRDIDATNAQINIERAHINTLEGVRVATAATSAQAEAASRAAWDNVSSWGAFQQSASFAATQLAIAANAAANVKARLAELAGQADVTGNALRSSFLGMAQVLGAAGAMAGLKEKEKELGALRQEWSYMGLTTDEMAFKEKEWLDNTNTALGDTRAKWQDLTSGVQAHGSAVSAAEQAYNGLLGKVQGVLSGALDVGVGIKAEDLLPREDAINENARRLADIAKNGLSGQSWLPDFQAQAPGAWADLVLKQAEGVDVKTAAGQILLDFQDGLRPDLIDPNRAKDIVRRAILGDQSMSAMAQQIASELSAEMGIPLQQAQEAAASVLGTGKSNVPGASDSGFANGFGQAANGATLVATMTAQMTAAYTEFDKAGTAAGTRWSTTFYSAVESGMAPQLIGLLVTLTTPGVLALIQAQTSTTTPPP